MFPVTEPDIDEHIFLLYSVKSMTGCCCTSCEERAGFSQTRSEIERCRFTSKEYDEETGLYYMSARYMNPVAGRWVSSDPAVWQLVNPMQEDDNGEFQERSGFSIIESMNPYSYVSNSPTNYSDPTGCNGQRESGSTPYFKNGRRYNVVDGMDALFSGRYRNEGGAVLSGGIFSSPFSSKGSAKFTMTVGALEKVLRSLPTGMGDSNIDAINGFLGNMLDPDTSVDVEIWAEYKGKGDKRRITKWGLKVPIPRVSKDSLNDGSVGLTVDLYDVPSRDTAEQIVLDNPELIEGILKEAGMLEYE
jgi:RHS repeat-associated protein